MNQSLIRKNLLAVITVFQIAFAVSVFLFGLRFFQMKDLKELYAFTENPWWQIAYPVRLFMSAIDNQTCPAGLIVYRSLDILRWLFILLLVLFWMSSFMEQDVKEAESLFCLTLIDFLASFVCLLLVTVSMRTLSYDTAMTLLKITGGILIVWSFILLGLYAGICIRILRKYRNRRIQAKNAV